MAFLCRIRQWNLRNLSQQLNRYYHLQISSSFLANQLGLHSIALNTWGSKEATCRRAPEFLVNARFYAAPVQAKKEEDKDASGPRINEQITAEFVRLVTDEGHGVVSRREALQRASNLKLDLVEVQRNAKPPVCKIMDYHKERYKQQVKEKDKTKSKSDGTLRKGDCKEVRFSAKTEQKDLKMKADTAKRLMEKGYRVKCMAMGTEDQDLGGLLSRLSAMMEDVAFVESGPRVEKRQAYVIVRHVKFGPSKKGKKASNVDVADTRKAATSPSPSAPNQDAVDFKEQTYSDLDNDDSVLGEESNQSTTGDFQKAFEFGDNANERTKAGLGAASSFQVPNFVPSVPRVQPDNRYRQSGVGKGQAAANSGRFQNQRSPPGTRDNQHDMPRREQPSRSGHSPATSGFGVFSTQDTRHGSGAEPHRGSGSFNSTQNSGPGRVGLGQANLSSPLSKPNRNPSSVSDRNGKWGVFSRESSNAACSESGVHR